MTAVLQADAKLWLDAARTKAHVVALNEAHHHAVLVGGAEVYGAALHRVTSAEVLRLFHINQLRARGQVRGGQHLLGRDFHRAGLGDVGIHISKGQLHGLDLQVLRIHTIDGQASHIELVQNAQRDQCCNALAVGRNLVQRVAPVIFGNGCDPFAAVVRKILRGQRATVFRSKGCNCLRDLTAIESAAPAGRDGAKAHCGTLELKQLADIRRAASRQECRCKTGKRLQFVSRRRPLLLHDG